MLYFDQCNRANGGRQFQQRCAPGNLWVAQGSHLTPQPERYAAVQDSRPPPPWPPEKGCFAHSLFLTSKSRATHYLMFPSSRRSALAMMSATPIATCAASATSAVSVPAPAPTSSGSRALRRVESAAELLTLISSSRPRSPATEPTPAAQILSRTSEPETASSRVRLRRLAQA